MSVKKRSIDQERTPASKKKKLDHSKDDSSTTNALASTSNLVLGEVDFPRGGGDSHDTLEYSTSKLGLTDGQEAGEDVVFKVCPTHESSECKSIQRYLRMLQPPRRTTKSESI